MEMTNSLVEKVTVLNDSASLMELSVIETVKTLCLLSGVVEDGLEM